VHLEYYRREVKVAVDIAVPWLLEPRHDGVFEIHEDHEERQDGKGAVIEGIRCPFTKMVVEDEPNPHSHKDRQEDDVWKVPKIPYVSRQIPYECQFQKKGDEPHEKELDSTPRPCHLT
jgi:hypothetical protein